MGRTIGRYATSLPMTSLTPSSSRSGTSHHSSLFVAQASAPLLAGSRDAEVEAAARQWVQNFVATFGDEPFVPAPPKPRCVMPRCTVPTACFDKTMKVLDPISSTVLGLGAAAGLLSLLENLDPTTRIDPVLKAFLIVALTAFYAAGSQMVYMGRFTQ